jgi:hypothetical protein
MKNILIVTSAAAVGGIVASLVCACIPHVEAASTEVRATSIVLVDGNGLAAARLGLVDGQTVLQFYNKDSTVALEVGVERTRQERFIHFFGAGHQFLAGLNSLTSGDSTLYLGNRSGVRVALGAFPNDVATDDPTTEWGMVFRKPGSKQNLFDLHVNSLPDSVPSAGLQLIRRNGEVWSIQ